MHVILDVNVLLSHYKLIDSFNEMLIQSIRRSGGFKVEYRYVVPRVVMEGEQNAACHNFGCKIASALVFDDKQWQTNLFLGICRLGIYDNL